ncbi:MAG: 2-hydroxyacyl-CoA dehydratase family protein [Pseudomonadota bacterium]
MMNAYFDAMVAGLEAKLAREPHRPRHRRLLALAMARLGQRLYQGREPVAWCGVLAPFDLLSAFGVTSCFVEFVGAMLSATGGVGPLLDVAGAAGFTPDACGYHRAVQGALRQGTMPAPDLLVATTSPCSSGVATLEVLARQFDRELFVLHIPLDEDPASVRFVTEQLRTLATHVTRVTGRELDEAVLRQVILRGNTMRELLLEVYALAARKPSPVRGEDLKNFGIVTSLLFGTDEGIAVVQAFRDELAARVERGEAGVPEASARLLWLQNRIQFKNDLVERIEHEGAAAVVVDELNDVTWPAIDPDRPFEGLARRCIALPLNGRVERRIAHLQDLAQRYQVDGAINPCHFGCRQGTGARGLVTQGLRDVGVPVLNLEVDCVDDRNFAAGPLRTRIEAFLETLGGGAT